MSESIIAKLRAGIEALFAGLSSTDDAAIADVRPDAAGAVFIAKDAADGPMVLVASGAYEDRDGEWVSGPEFLQQFAKGINDGEIEMSLDWWHVGYPSRSNPQPKSEKIVLGRVAKAEFANDHLALMPEFASPEIEQTVRHFAKETGLSIWFSGATRGADNVFRAENIGKQASVALMPLGYESYAYTSIS